MYVALDKAIRDRLEGNPRDRLGNPQNPATNPGLWYPIYARTDAIRTPQFNPFDVVPNQKRMCPIFKRSSQGEEWNGIFPCATFSYVGVNQNSDVWLPPVGKNKIVTHSGTPVTIRNQAGEIVAVGQPTNIEHPLPEGFNILIQIEVRAKMEYEAMALLHSLYQVFPQKGQLTVQQSDGSHHHCDMLMQGDTVFAVPETPAVEDAAAEQGAFRENTYITTYLIEGYQDTTWAYLKTSRQAITQGISLEMTFPDMPEADNLNTREGVLEVIDLKKLM